MKLRDGRITALNRATAAREKIRRALHVSREASASVNRLAADGEPSYLRIVAAYYAGRHGLQDVLWWLVDSGDEEITELFEKAPWEGESHE